MKRQKGFTLIELIIVIMVITILGNMSIRVYEEVMGYFPDDPKPVVTDECVKYGTKLEEQTSYKNGAFIKENVRVKACVQYRVDN